MSVKDTHAGVSATAEVLAGQLQLEVPHAVKLKYGYKPVGPLTQAGEAEGLVVDDEL